MPSFFFFQVGLKEVEDILRDVDLNGDGLVDFEGKETFTNVLKIFYRVWCNCSIMSSTSSLSTEFVRMMSH